MEKCPRHLNIVLTRYVVKEQVHLLHQAWSYGIKHGVKFIKYRQNKPIVTKYVQNLRLVDKCVCDLLSQFFHSRNVVTAVRCAWSAASRKTIKRTSLLQSSQQIFIPFRFQFLSENSRISRRAP